MHGHILDDILESFKSQRLSITDFLLTSLSKEREQSLQPAFEDLITDLLSNIVRILDSFASHPRVNETVNQWVHNKAKSLYLQEARHMSSKDAGFHFNAIKAQAHQIIGFNTDTLISQVAQDMPYLWDLSRSLSHQNEPAIMLSDIDNSLRARDIKSLMRIGGILFGLNRRCNLFASIMGVFLHTCNTPTRVINALWRLDVCISSSSIDNAIDSLSQEAERNIKAAGKTLCYSYVLDNFDIQKKHPQPVVEQSEQSMFHLTAGTLIRLVHCSVSDLAFSSYLWERSRYNDIRSNSIPRLSIYNLLSLHPEKLVPNALTRKEQFMAWMFACALCTHGPQYFRQFISRIREPDGIEKIPPVKTQQIPLRAMQYQNSTVEGNIKAIEAVLKQCGINELTTLSIPGIDNAEELVIFVHGDLGTGERIQSARIRRSIERSAQQRLQFVIFVPGLFHVKMACVDALCRLFIEPVAGRKDDSSFFAFVDRMYPNDSSKIATNKAGFHMINDCITRVGTADRLECWRSHIETHYQGCSSLEDFATKEPTLNQILHLSGELAKQYSTACSQVERFRVSDTPEECRDKQYENTLLRIDYFMLYEELTYAIRRGDVGRIETCLRRWIPIFRGVGKHKYATMLLEFMVDLHFVYPERLRRAIRYNWLCNPQGTETGFRGVDWLLEVNNLYTKVIYGGSGSNNTIERIIKESVLISLFRDCMKVIEHQFVLTPSTTKHGDPDLTTTYAELSRHAQESELLCFKAGRDSKYIIRDAFNYGMSRINEDAPDEDTGDTLEEATVTMDDLSSD